MALFRRRREAGAVLLVVAALALTGCAPNAQQQAEAVLTDFLDALREGDYRTAAELSTTDPAEFACEGMLATDGDISIGAPEVQSFEVDGDRAHARIDYYAPGEATLELELVRAEDGWRVELPEDFRIAVRFDGPVVGEMIVDEECRMSLADGHAEMLAWPGLYRIEFEDPSGVVSWDTTLYSVPDQQTLDGDPRSLAAVPERELLRLSVDAIPLLRDAMAACRPYGGPARADCPGVFSGVTLDEDSRLPARYVEIERIWSEDGAQWRFETPRAPLDVLREGVPEQVEFRFRGTLHTDPSGELRLDLDGSV